MIWMVLTWCSVFVWFLWVCVAFCCLCFNLVVLLLVTCWFDVLFIVVCLDCLVLFRLVFICLVYLGVLCLLSVYFSFMIVFVIDLFCCFDAGLCFDWLWLRFRFVGFGIDCGLVFGFQLCLLFLLVSLLFWLVVCTWLLCLIWNYVVLYTRMACGVVTCLLEAVRLVDWFVLVRLCRFVITSLLWSVLIWLILIICLVYGFAWQFSFRFYYY